MPSEKERMLAGEMYDPQDAELSAMRERARDLCQDLNASRDNQGALRRRSLVELFGSGGDYPLRRDDRFANRDRRA
jgi:maltose O-acetyltransferase